MIPQSEIDEMIEDAEKFSNKCNIGSASLFDIKLMSDRPRKHSGPVEDIEREQFKKFLISRMGWWIGQSDKHIKELSDTTMKPADEYTKQFMNRLKNGEIKR